MCPTHLLPPLLILASFSSFAGRPVYAVREYPEVTITGINAETKSITVRLPKGGGSQSLRVGPKTWIIKDDEEAAFADLRVGQRLRVRYIPRGGLAVTLEVLPTKGKGAITQEE
jgi:hypothetical protein